MVYKPTIPQSNDFISQSQKDMIGNFETLSDIWGKPNTENANVGDHVSFIDPKEDDRGRHKKLTMPEQSSAPTTLANELGLYTKEQGGTAEIFYREESNGTENQLTSSRRLNTSGLVLRAYVAFDFQGNIIEVEQLDAEGEVVKVKQQFNVSSITNNTQVPPDLNLLADWTINFTNPLPTADYFWICQSMNNNRVIGFSPRVVQAQPKNDATYGNVVTVNNFKFLIANVFGSGSSGSITAFARGLRMVFQAYTVA